MLDLSTLMSFQEIFRSLKFIIIPILIRVFCPIIIYYLSLCSHKWNGLWIVILSVNSGNLNLNFTILFVVNLWLVVSHVMGNLELPIVCLVTNFLRIRFEDLPESNRTLRRLPYFLRQGLISSVSSFYGSIIATTSGECVILPRTCLQNLVG